MADFYWGGDTDGDLGTVANWYSDMLGTPAGSLPTAADTAILNSSYYVDTLFGVNPYLGVCVAGTVNLTGGGGTSLAEIDGGLWSGTINFQDAYAYTLAGVFTGLVVMTDGELDGGIFANDVTVNGGTISGSSADFAYNKFDGSGACTVTNAGGTISSGKFYGNVVQTSGTISGGKFYWHVTNSGTVSGGTFYDTFTRTAGDVTSGARINANGVIGSGGTWSPTLVLFDVVRTKVDNSLTGGTLVLPAVANVRYGTAYGVGGTGSTGTVSAPNSGSATGTEDATSDACVASGKNYGAANARTGTAAGGGGPLVGASALIG